MAKPLGPYRNESQPSRDYRKLYAEDWMALRDQVQRLEGERHNWQLFAMWGVLAYDIWAAGHGADQRYPSREVWEQLGEMIDAYGARALLEEVAK